MYIQADNSTLLICDPFYFAFLRFIAIENKYTDCLQFILKNMLPFFFLWAEGIDVQNERLRRDDNFQPPQKINIGNSQRAHSLNCSRFDMLVCHTRIWWPYSKQLTMARYSFSFFTLSCVCVCVCVREWVLFQFFIGHLFQLDSVRSFHNNVSFLSPSTLPNPLAICTTNLFHFFLVKA